MTSQHRKSPALSNPLRLLAATAFGLVLTAVVFADNAALTAVPKGLPKVSQPKDNAPSEAKIKLGKQLFFDPRLSLDSTISCASCHDPAKGWSNGEQFATGVGGQKGGRNTPTIINSAYGHFQFWDGRAGSLEEQALGPIQNPIEMKMTLPELEKRLNAISGYRRQFKEVFGSDVTAKNIAKAIAAYERTILSGDAPYDRFKAGDKKALSPAAQRGMKVFYSSKAHCTACHSGPNFTDGAFHNIGVGMDRKEADKGRTVVSKLGGDTGAFKTPTLREIARTAPYMHDGSMKTLEEVVQYYNKGGIPNDYLDEEIYKLNLTKQEMQDLVTFLKEGLSSKSYPEHTAPELPE